MASNHIINQPTLREEDLKPARTYTVTYAVRKTGDDRARGVYEIMRGELIVDTAGNGAAFDTGTAEVVAIETTAEMFPHDTLNMARKHATVEAPAFEWRYYVEMYRMARRCREIALQSYVGNGREAPDYLNAWLEQQEDTAPCQ